MVTDLEMIPTMDKTAIRTVRHLFFKMVFVFIAATLLSACSDTTPDCFISDQATLLDERKIKGDQYFLVLKITGWHDKVQSLELYNIKPEFDVCGISKTEYIDEHSLQLENQFVSKVRVKDKKLQITYKPGKRYNHTKNLKLQ